MNKRKKACEEEKEKEEDSMDRVMSANENQRSAALSRRKSSCEVRRPREQMEKLARLSLAPPLLFSSSISKTDSEGEERRRRRGGGGEGG